MMDFSSHAGAVTGSDTIPNGQVAFAVLQIRGVKASASGGAYIDCELTIADGQPFARRKVFEKIGHPFNQGNSEAYRQMGMVAITRICEAARGASPSNPEGYKLTKEDFSELNGLTVPIKIGIEEGKDGHDDKNRVAEWLTPNPASKSGFKHYERLLRKEYAAASSAPAQAATGFGGQPTSGFGQGGNGAGSSQGQGASAGFGNASPQTGFQQAAPGNSAPGNGFATSAGNQSPPADASAAPSSGTPAWLGQANGAPQQ